MSQPAPEPDPVGELALPAADPPPAALAAFHGYEVVEVLRPGERHKARVLLCRRGEQLYVVKELSTMSPLFRVLYGRWLLRREARMLGRLAGVEGVPDLVEVVPPDAIVLLHSRGAPMGRRRKGRMPEILASLERAVEAIHARGIVHLDLRQKRNILIRRTNEVTILDFETALDLSRGPLRRLFFSRLVRIDRAAVLKWRANFAPESLTAQERETVLRYQSRKRFWPFKRLGRGLRRLFGRDEADGDQETP